ncbi:MAG: AsmA-like C-terminal domain-containing protein [Proteobacteria bacterium]|nr:AsmA-like C-terminal domain-containing protein [Pseudomonadota bacterium]MBU1739033.1 AsmA-like C-terminal domain-containing protein [Pseudomonadota bacterium]
MKKTVPVIFIVLVFVGLLCFSPQLLKIKSIKDKAVNRISVETGWALDTERFHWRWLPLPHAALYDTSINKEGVSIHLPETRIFPSWKSLIRGKIEFGKISLFSPLLEINNPDLLSFQHSSNPFTTGSIQIINGQLTFPGRILPPGVTQAPPVVISGIEATLAFSGDRIDFGYSGSSSLCNILDIQGFYSRTDAGYRIDYELAGLDVQKIIPALLDGRLVPFRSMLNLRGHLEGNGFNRYIVEADGDFPCFASPSDIDSLFLNCGTARFRIEKNEENLQIDIDELQLKTPELTLSGRIARLHENVDPDSSLNDESPLWLIDLAGRDLDLTSIRKTILTLWGDNHIARTVCEIVLGGRAKTASYYFKAPLKGFDHIENMTIKADADGVIVLPPMTNLHLTDASGPIEIKNGFLTGAGLTAQLGKSMGNNGSLLLDLTGKTEAFKLDLDIKADVSDLPKVLIDLVDHDQFRKETGRFVNSNGWAKGHLKIGDTLDNLQVNVLVDSMNVKTKNSHLPWPILLNGGQLKVEPHKVSWMNARGSIGPHLIQRFSGNVDWSKDISFSVKSLESSIDSTPLLRELKRKAIIPVSVADKLENIEGPLNLTSTTVKGKFSDPASWSYSCLLSSSGSRWASNLLPHPIFAENLQLKITEKTIGIENSKIWFIEQPITVSGELTHTRLTDLHGWLKFNGTIRETSAEWLKSKKLFPEKYFPKLPCTLKDLKINWARDEVSLTGTIAAGLGVGDSPTVRIDLVDNTDRFVINELVFSSKTEIGKLNLEYFKDDSNRFKLKWQGFVSSSTVRKLLPYNLLRAEHLEGDFSLLLPFTGKTSPFNGWLRTSEYKKPDKSDSRGFTLKKLDIASTDDLNITIRPSLFATGENDFEISGTVGISDNLLDLALALRSKKINKEAIGEVLESVGKSLGEDSDKQTDSPPVQTTGRINFQIDRFESAPPPDQNTAKQPGNRYIVSPFQGFVTLHPESNYSLNVRSSKVCGLDISGTFHSTPSLGDNSFNIYTDSASPPLLQETLPCFGIQQDLIEGSFHADINVSGTHGIWTGGEANIYSENGFIKRLGFLSKAFSIINLTDLFQKNTLPDMANEGFTYSRFDIKSFIRDNKVFIEKGVLKGSGLNLFTQGEYDLGSHQADLTMMVAPLKTVDAIVTNIPLIGKIAGGADNALISIPVGIKGNLHDPAVTLLPPGAIGKGLFNLITNTLSLPFTVFSPLTKEVSP